MSEDTVVLQVVPRLPAPGVLPGLIAAVVLFGAAAGYFYLQGARRAQALDSAQAQVAALQSKASEADKRIEKLESQLAAQQLQLEQNSQLPLPLDITFRAGRPGSGLIARLQNLSNADINVAVRPRHIDTGETREFDLRLPAHALAELGQAEGWAFQSGDSLSVKSGSYQPLSLRAP
jgi:multidrug efflux pump subunit AcrA (membrane-fusion protein)